MDFLNDLKRQFPEEERRKYTEQERLERLGIGPDEIKKIEGLEFRRIDVDNDEYNIISVSVISVADIIGINRQDQVENWIDCLFGLHKLRHFDIFPGREKYEQFLQIGDESSEHLPGVIELDGRYYVSTNGKHRITFAKCLGIEKICTRIYRKA